MRRLANSDRTRAFFLATLESQINQLVGPPVSAVVMARYGPYAAYFISWAVMSLSIPTLFFMTDTSHSRKLAETEQHHGDHEADSEDQQTSGVLGKLQVKNKLHDMGNHFKHDIFPLFKNSTVLRCLCIIFLTRFCTAVTAILAQYMHVRYHWSYEQVRSVSSVERLLLAIDYSNQIILSGDSYHRLGHSNSSCP
jgi:hypothetical protein